MLEKINELQIPIINFTSLELKAPKVFNFLQFNLEIIRIISDLPSAEIILIDVGYSIQANQKHNIEQNLKIVQNHVNLTNLNPFIGQVPPKFFAVNNLYKTNSFPSLENIIVAGLNPNCKPSPKQSQILSEIKVSYYSYNLVLASLVAAFYNKNVIGIIQSQ